MAGGVNGLRILIADNYEVFRRGLRALLEARQKWKVCGEAATGREAIEKTQDLRPDLLLLDVDMPDMDATQVIPEIISLCPAVKIVALAMRDSADLASMALAAGASGVALRSDSASDLILSVQSVGRNNPFLSPAAVRMISSQLARTRTSGPTPSDLTPRELETLKLLASGRGNKEVAKTLAISVKTVDAHRTNIMRRLKLRTYSDLVHFAIRHKIIEL